jgi:hypothetical protein
MLANYSKVRSNYNNNNENNNNNNNENISLFSLQNKINVKTHKNVEKVHDDNEVNDYNASLLWRKYSKLFWRKILTTSRLIRALHLKINLNSKIQIKFNILNFCSMLAHSALVVQLSFLTNKTSNAYFWFHLGLLLNLFFIVQIILKMCTGLKEFFSAKFNIFDVAVNFLSFVFLMILLPSYSSKEKSIFQLTTTMVLFLILQSLRLLHLFFFFNDINILEDIYPIVVRAIFIYFSVIYFFSGFYFF